MYLAHAKTAKSPLSLVKTYQHQNRTEDTETAIELAHDLHHRKGPEIPSVQQEKPEKSCVVVAAWIGGGAHNRTKQKNSVSSLCGRRDIDKPLGDENQRALAILNMFTPQSTPTTVGAKVVIVDHDP